MVAVSLKKFFFKQKTAYEISIGPVGSEMCIRDSAKTVKKEISDILESVYEKDYVKISEGSNVGGNLKKHLKALDKKMKEAASNLEFEEAAKIRDEIRKLESTELEITLNPKIRQYDVKNKLYPKGRSTMGMPGTKVTKKRDKKWKHGRS